MLPLFDDDFEELFDDDFDEVGGCVDAVVGTVGTTAVCPSALGCPRGGAKP
jgi:hypothetical protein